MKLAVSTPGTPSLGISEKLITCLPELSIQRGCKLLISAGGALNGGIQRAVITASGRYSIPVFPTCRVERHYRLPVVLPHYPGSN